MHPSSTCQTTISPRFRIPLFLALLGGGLAGNYFNLPIFLNIDFIFGSIFALLALQFLGIGWGILAAAIISSLTLSLWQHPYAIIIFTAEVAIVGWLTVRRQLGLMVAATLYWLMVGMPLVYLFYHLVMQMSASNTELLMVKQAVNGLANALLARLIYDGFAILSRSSQVAFNELIYNLLALFVLGPTLFLLTLDARADFAETDRHIRTTLLQDSLRVDQRLRTWVQNRRSAIINLAEMAATRSPEQLQPFLEEAAKGDGNFLRIGLLDQEAISTAFFPLLDELGQHNIGKNYADRPFIPQLKQTLQPMLSEVVMARVGLPRPSVIVLAPVLTNGAYGGFVAGVLHLQQLQEYLEISAHVHNGFYSLLDKNGNVIMTNRPGQAVMAPLLCGPGEFIRLGQELSQWVPALPANTSIMKRWQESFYVAATPIGDLAEWRLIMEQPLAPFQKTLASHYAARLTMLGLIFLLALALAQLLSRRLLTSLETLRGLTLNLPAKLAAKSPLEWPCSGVKEQAQLINNFREMAASLSAQFRDNQRMVEDLQQTKEAMQEANHQLERRVRERTAELQTINTALSVEIAERQRTGEQVVHSLQEKTVMLKEIHHRVKNNLQVIYSLLSLQAQAVTDPATRGMFVESQNRVLSMALIHEHLYRADDLASIDFKKYLQSLMDRIAETYSRPDVALLVEMEPLALNINVGIPLGLIVNELVVNCLKYAFPGGRAGEIRIGITGSRAGEHLLTVADNGVGFPAGLDFRHTQSLGLQLVTVLTGQIHGTFELTREGGAKFLITFPAMAKQEM